MEQFLNFNTVTNALFNNNNNNSVHNNYNNIINNNSFQFDSCDQINSFCPSSGRKFVVFDEEKKGGKECDSSGSVSTLTFLNFVIGSLSLAANLVSNVNSNSNNNNNNNNDNNNNDNNINIGNSNNNVNSQNQLTFLPMVGRRAIDRKIRSIFWSKREELCQEHRQGKTWLAKCAIRTIELFVRLESCRKNNREDRQIVELCQNSEICDEKNVLSNISDPSELLVLSHLVEGTANIVGLQFDQILCNWTIKLSN